MSEQIKIDVWGQVEGTDNYRIKPPDRVGIDAPAMGDGYAYEWFFDECPCAIQRTHTITSGGRAVIRKEVAYDDVGNRESATYYPINQQPLTVLRQEIIYSGGTQYLSAVQQTSSSYTLNSSASLRYGSGGIAFAPGSYNTGQAIITSSGTLNLFYLSPGTYTFTAFLTAPLAKPVPVSFVITVTNS